MARADRANGYTVGAVAGLAGVTVRTLHHYGEIGLLEPSGRTAGGYRQYGAADLDRLGRILYYRELGFPLDRIAELLRDTTTNPVGHLQRQHAMLVKRRVRLAAMIAAVERELNAVMSGIKLTSEEKLEIFGSKYDESWEEEAERRWGDTDAWRDSQAKAATLTKDDWKRMAAETEAMHAQVVEIFRSGVAPGSEAAMDVAEGHRQWVRTHWDCTPDAHRNLVGMYLADERFTKTYEDMAPGLT